MSARFKGRRREVAKLVADLASWADTRTDLVAVGVVGSYAYGRPRMVSDIDLVLLAHDPGAYGEWLAVAGPLAPARFLGRRQWGPLIEWRFRRPSGLQVEVGIVTPAWANIDPLDSGTARVLRDGLQIVHDPAGILDRARAAAEDGPTEPGARG